MSASSKAEAFILAAKGEGWDGTMEHRNGDEVHVKVTRNDEVITIWWRGNSLIETPFHHFAGQVRSLHNKATATRQLALRPNPKRIVRRRSVALGEPTRDPEDQQVDIESLRYPLPFDIWEDPDNVILKALRGSTIVYVNSVSQHAEEIHIPRAMNMNLKHFNLAESSDGKPFVNFVCPTGFRSVHLESILRVV